MNFTLQVPWMTILDSQKSFDSPARRWYHLLAEASSQLLRDQLETHMSLRADPDFVVQAGLALKHWLLKGVPIDLDESLNAFTSLWEFEISRTPAQFIIHAGTKSSNKHCSYAILPQKISM